MGSKKNQEFQITVSSADEFERYLKESEGKKSLLVVDLHSTWAGSCRAIVPVFRKCLFDYDFLPLTFLIADSDKLAAGAQSILDRTPSAKFTANWYKGLVIKYTGRSMPVTLLFYAGALRDVVENVDLPRFGGCMQAIVADMKQDHGISAQTVHQSASSASSLEAAEDPQQNGADSQEAIASDGGQETGGAAAEATAVVAEA